MNISELTRTAVGVSQYAKTTGAGKTAKDAVKDEKETAAQNSAYAVEISDVAKAKQAKADVQDTAQTGEKTKGLTNDAVDALKADTEKSYALMIQTMTEQNAKLQAWQDKGIGWLNFDGNKVETFQFTLPEVATTPEEAAKAVADGGDWSINAVADRIFGMATAIAGNDPEKLSAMQAAIEKGFEQAGITFKEVTGEEDMPQITKDTHAEISKRFDDLYASLGVKTADEAEA